MEITYKKTKLQYIKEILFKSANLIMNIIFLVFIISGIILLASGLKYGIGFIFGGVYYYILVIIRIVKTILKKDLTVKLKLDNRDLLICSGQGILKLPYDSILKMIDKNDKIHIKISKGYPLKSFVLSKKYIEGNSEIFLIGIKEKLSNNKYNTLSNKNSNPNEFVLTQKNSVIDNLLQTMSVEYRKVRTIFLFLVDLFFGLMLYFSENAKLAGYVLLTLALMVLLKPLLVVLLKKGSKTIDFYIKNNKLEIVNNITVDINIDTLRISNNNKNQTIIRSKDNKFCFKIDDTQIVKGNTSKLFEYIEYDDRVLNTSILGVMSISFSLISFISIVFTLKVGAIAVVICLLTWLISLICSVINLLKKDVYKKFALISLINDIVIFLFYVLVFINIR